VSSRQRYAVLLTRDVLLQATIARKSDYKLAEELDIPPTAIQYYRKKYSIKSGCPSRGFGLATAHLREAPIPEDVIGCIVGGTLGDGGLYWSPQHNPALAFFATEHEAKQREWAEYKRQRLGSLVLMPLREMQRTTSYTPNGMTTYRFSTVTHPTLGEMRQQFYDGHRKRVTKELLQLLTVEGFVWWFYDDGSLTNKNYTLCVCQFSLEEVKLIREMLRRKFGLLTTPLKAVQKATGKTYYTLYFARATVSRLQEMLRLVPVPCMRYKIDRSSETLREEPAKAVIKSDPTGDGGRAAETPAPATSK
jgi:hypothetical protein